MSNGFTAANRVNTQVPLKKVVTQTLASLFYPEVLLLLFLPLFVSVVVIGLGFFLTMDLWTGVYSIGQVQLKSGLFQLFPILSGPFFTEYFSWISFLFPVMFVIFLIGLAFPLVLVCNLLITSVLTSSYLVRLIAKRDFKNLQPLGKPRFAQGVVNTFVAIFIYLFVWMLTMPLWLIPGVQLILPILLTGWLNRRVCTFDALTDYASDEEFQRFSADLDRKGYLVGLATAGFNYVPFAFFISPVFTMVAFIYFQLGNLQASRGS